MNVVIVGGGPAGLYLALLLRKADPTHRVTVAERNAPDDTFGWGVVFSDQTLENFRRADAETHDAIAASFAHWDDIDIHVRDRVITSGGHGFSGIARTRLIDILQRRAAALGVDLRFRCEIASPDDVARLGVGEPDLLVAADGANSAIRHAFAEHFRPDLDVRSARFIWLGTTKLFDAFTFIFVENEWGVFQVHAYRFDETRSAFIVECDEASWRAAGFDGMDAAATVARCEEMFARWLDGHALMHNAAHQRERPWLRFVRVGNERWFHDRVVLMGDAAHTAHFSIGSGTKLAMEDAIALARILEERGDGSLADSLGRYQAERHTEALRLQNAARNSMEWFENVKRYIRLEPEQFAYSLLTRSQRVSHENLRLRDRSYLTGVERWLAMRASGTELEQVPPPMFTPWRLRGMALENRIVVAPMDMYSATDGTPNDFHLVHLGSRALGGAGLVVTEMTCVTPDGRITKGCTGMYDAAHVAAWRRIVQFVHAWSRASICLQLGHAGRKGATRLPWEGGELAPDPDERWTVLAPSATAWAPGLRVPREMTRADMDAVRDAHVRAAKMAIEAGFDMVELHCAHGYLLSSFITPLGNHRSDEYGGSLDNRLRYPLEVFRAMREVWPAERPMSVRISATDWVVGGLSADESVCVARAFGEAGVDVVHVSTGQTSIHAKPVYGRMYQTPYSDRIRNESGVPTIAVGNIVEPDQVNAIIAAGRADLCALARPHLTDPHWTLRAAAELRWSGHAWPVQYEAGRRQRERRLEREAEMRGSSTI